MESKTSYKIALPELIYLLYFTFLFGAKAIGLYEGRLDYNILLLLGLLTFIVKVAATEHTVCEYAIMGVLLGVCMLVYWKTGEKGLLLYFTMMLGMKAVSLKKVMQYATALLGTCFFVLVLLTSFGFMQDITYLHDRRFFGQVIRHSLGYPYPNTLFTTYIILLVLIFYVMGKQTVADQVKISVLMFVGSIFIYLYSCSNTGLIVSAFYLFVNFYLQQKKKISVFEKIVVIAAYPLGILVSVGAPLLIKGEMFQKLDKILHNRMAYPQYFLMNEPITLFGTRFKPTENTNMMVDSSFLYSFLQIGIIPFIIVTTLMMYMIIDCVKKEKRTEMAIILSFCLLGLSDPFLFNLSYKNLLFLFVGELLYQVLEQREEKMGAFWKTRICLLSWVEKIFKMNVSEKEYVIVLPARMVEACKQFGEKVKKAIKDNKTILFWTLLGAEVVICAVIYLFSYSAHVVGAIDIAEEWEYVRRVLSYGIYGSILIATIIVGVTMRKSQTRA